jgi:hypothetical protein
LPRRWREVSHELRTPLSWIEPPSLSSSTAPPAGTVTITVERRLPPRFSTSGTPGSLSRLIVAAARRLTKENQTSSHISGQGVSFMKDV